MEISKCITFGFAKKGKAKAKDKATKQGKSGNQIIFMHNRNFTDKKMFKFFQKKRKEMFLTIKHSGKDYLAPIQVDGVGANAIDEIDTNHNEEKDATSSEKPLATLGDLRDWISNETGCDLGTMKLIWKGKYIVDTMDKPLQNFKFKSTDKIMVMGATKRDSGLQLLLDFEKTQLTKLTGTFKLNEEDLTELEKNFLQGEMLQEMLARMEKRLKEFTENSLRHLESIDALQIYSENITEEQKKRNREKRKCLVEKVQALLRENDKFSFRIEQYRKSLEFPKL